VLKSVDLFTEIITSRMLSDTAVIRISVEVGRSINKNNHFKIVMRILLPFGITVEVGGLN
jgi:hypothetical protein